MGTDKHFLFAGEHGVTFVSSRTGGEFTVPFDELSNSSFECPICSEKDSVKLAVQTVV
jgi:hypothetical protein